MSSAPAEGSGIARGPEPGGWKVVHAVAAFGAGVLASILAAVVVLPGGATVFESFAVVGTVQFLVTLAVVAMLRRAPGRPPLGLRFRPVDGGALLLGAALALLVSWATYVVLHLLGVHAPDQVVVQTAAQAVGLGTQAAVVVAAVLLAPISEELVFRGVLLQALRGKVPDWAGGLISAAAFGLVHLALDPMSWAAVPALFVLGLVLAFLVQRTGRLGPAMLTHAGFNLVGVLSLLLT